ncbi:alpha/beta hydrolase [Geodermatophilaceae bacterium NBWT11]|nr:alpha/beta hydrolase [Geodermatophilaceae bacterium NBWT11]
MSGHTGPDVVVVDDGVVAGRGGEIPVRDYRPASPAARTALLWVHGGGFTSGGLDQQESDAPARFLAAAGTPVRTVDYRLAPRALPWRDPDLTPHPGRYPAGLDDVVDVARALIEASGGPIAIGGGSAGANLAAATVLRLRDEGLPLPRSAVLAYGTFHAVLPEDEQVESELSGILAKWAFNPTMTRRMNLNYVGEPGALAPGYPFPGGADLRDFPPTLLVDARNDRLRKSGHTFAAELRAAGSEVRETVVEAQHGFLNKPRKPAFATGMRDIAAWLTAHD